MALPGRAGQGPKPGWDRILQKDQKEHEAWRHTVLGLHPRERPVDRVHQQAGPGGWHSEFPLRAQAEAGHQGPAPGQGLTYPRLKGLGGRMGEAVEKHP